MRITLMLVPREVLCYFLEQHPKLKLCTRRLQVPVRPEPRSSRKRVPKPFADISNFLYDDMLSVMHVRADDHENADVHGIEGRHSPDR